MFWIPFQSQSRSQLRLFSLGVVTALLQFGGNVGQVNALPNSLENQPQSRALHNVTASNKAGLGWNNPQSTNMTQFFRTDTVGWYYTWSSWANDQASNLDFVPLLWGKDKLSEWTDAVNNRLKPLFQNKNITCVLGFNEPQEAHESNINATEAASLWMQYIQPLKTQYGVRLGTPATSSAPSGKNWTQDFITACRNCTIDFVALHYYGNNATDMINYITDFHNTFQKPIWVTEWACHDYSGKNQQCDQTHVDEYMNTTQSFMDRTDWVERYSWFGALVDNPITATNSLLTSGGKITALGQQYIKETPEQIAQGTSSSTLSTHASTSGGNTATASRNPTPTTVEAAVPDGSGNYPTFSTSHALRVREMAFYEFRKGFLNGMGAIGIVGLVGTIFLLT